MKKTTETKYCGNCGSHNVYEFPTKQFCSTRHGQNKDPIVATLWCCKNWNPTGQECYCTREALKKSKPH